MALLKDRDAWTAGGASGEAARPETPPGEGADETEGTGELTLADVTSYLRAEGLSVHKLPERLEVVDALPRDETLRKVLKYRLRERYA